MARIDQNERGFWDFLPRPFVGLAPMDGVTDAPCRQMTVLTAGKQKPDVIFTEFVAVEALIHGGDRALQPFLYQNNERPLVAQVYGADPAAFRLAAQVVAALGFDGLDINMGCPAKKVSRRGAGAALITNPELAEQIITACKEGLADWAGGQLLAQIGVKPKVRRLIETRRAALGWSPTAARRVLPLSVKTRIGFDHPVVEEWAGFLAGQKLAAVAWHGRTLQQLYSGTADWEAIGRAAAILRQNSDTLVIGNGDLTSRAVALDHARRYHLDGTLIGRAALGNPWAFTDRHPSNEERVTAVLDHARLHAALLPPAAFPAFRRHLAAYTKGLPHAAAIRARLMTATDADAVARILSTSSA